MEFAFEGIGSSRGGGATETREEKNNKNNAKKAKRRTNGRREEEEEEDVLAHILQPRTPRKGKTLLDGALLHSAGKGAMRDCEELSETHLRMDFLGMLRWPFLTGLWVAGFEGERRRGSLGPRVWGPGCKAVGPEEEDTFELRVVDISKGPQAFLQSTVLGRAALSLHLVGQAALHEVRPPKGSRNLLWRALAFVLMLEIVHHPRYNIYYNDYNNSYSFGPWTLLGDLRALKRLGPSNDFAQPKNTPLFVGYLCFLYWAL